MCERILTLPKELSSLEKCNIRQGQSLPVFKEFKNWLESTTEAQALSKSPIRQAVNYTSDGELSIDNNLSERTLRMVVICIFAGYYAGKQSFTGNTLLNCHRRKISY